MIIEDHNHETEKAEPVRPLTTSLESLHSYDPELPPPYYDPTTPLLGKGDRKRRSIRGFACWTLGILAAFALLVISLPHLFHPSSPTPTLPDTEPFPTSSTSTPPRPPKTSQPASTVQPVEPLPTSLPHGSSCISSHLWTRHGSVSSTSVKLPIDAEVLRFDKIGSHAQGTISFTSLPVGLGSSVNVEVLAHHPDDNILDRAGICVRRGESNGVHGVTLLTNVSDAHPAGPVDYDVRIYLPGPSTYMPGRPRHYNRLETNLLDFRHEVQLPIAYIEFKSVDLRSSMSRMSIPELSAQEINIKTSQFPINGCFDVGSALALETDLSHIEASVKLRAQAGGATTSLSMKTTEGATRAQVRCIPSLLHLGDFQITSLNTNASSSITVPSLPFGAGLNVDARTTAEMVDVRLPLSFEGHFDLQGPSSILDYDRFAQDPQGHGRLRFVSFVPLGQRVRGTALWKSLFDLPRTRPRDKNMILMRTTENGTMTLTL